MVVVTLHQRSVVMSESADQQNAPVQVQQDTRCPSSDTRSKETKTCSSCEQPISRANPGLIALNKNFHRTCFKCKGCDKAIDSTFFVVDTQPTCQDCYQ
ncbi:LIM domain protein, partial [Ostertagia ostertagi]